MRTCNADGETADDAADDEVGDVLRRALQDGADDPDDGGDLERAAAAQGVGEKTGDEGSDERAAGHGGGDAALHSRGGVVEELHVGLGADPGAHGADVEAKEHAADGAEGGEG